jgi:hypothetical protein
MQYIELLLEDAPDNRAQTYETLDEAILRHEQDFDEFDKDEY